MKNILLIALISFTFSCFSQQVISTSGDFYQADEFSLSWSLGETVAETLGSDEFILTQGFQQPRGFTYSQIINIPMGWSGISSYIDPANKNLNFIFADLQDQLTILRNFQGIYYPAQNINTLGGWEFTSGYQTKASEAFEINLKGSRHDGYSLSLESGWSLVPVLTSCEVNVETLFQNNMGLILAKEVAGPGVFWPEYGINTMQDLKPGKAYFLLLNNTESIDFPNCEDIWSCSKPMLDERDGSLYETVQIGDQCWMAENLNIGLKINGAQDQLQNGIIEKYCYGDQDENCILYGGLYQWDEVMQYTEEPGAIGICPSGWHIPTDDEWKILEGTTDSQYPLGDPEWDLTSWRGYDAGNRLKSSSNWYNSGNGSNIFGFNGLPAGSRYPEGIFNSLGFDGTYWTSNVTNEELVWRRKLYYNENGVDRHNSLPKTFGRSVRCLKDE
jgi:uncharacterized protein (TIGR02145 family)